jgi:DNA polymerase-3 subunit epsilon
LELVNRRLTGRTFHHYLQPDRDIDEGAVAVHGITSDFLRNKPRFADVVDAFLAFVDGAELVIHNAPFDMGFLNQELLLLGRPDLTSCANCTVLDTLTLARHKHPGQKNNLDALAKRYAIEQRDRRYHGALLDAEILADVYLAMTGGQVGLSLHEGDAASSNGGGQALETIRRLAAHRSPLPIITPTPEELAAHELRLQAIDKVVGGPCLFRRVDATQ